MAGNLETAILLSKLRSKDPMTGSVMSRPAAPEWQPEYQRQEEGLEAVSPEDFIPNPKSMIAALKGVPAIVGLGTAATKSFGRDIVPEVLRAEQRLSPRAKQFSSNWNMNWNRGHRDFLDSPTGKEIDSAFDPVREKIRRTYGDTMPLFRGERGATDPEKLLFSWTPDEMLAKKFAANSPRIPKEIPDRAVEEALANYDRRGFTTFGKYTLSKSKDDPRYFNIYNRNELLTDGDNIERFLRGEQKDRADYISKLLSKGTVHQADVPVESMFWVPTGANLREPEIISRFNPRGMK